jgi:hypothetical protein
MSIIRNPFAQLNLNFAILILQKVFMDMVVNNCMYSAKSKIYHFFLVWLLLVAVLSIALQGEISRDVYASPNLEESSESSGGGDSNDDSGDKSEAKRESPAGSENNNDDDDNDNNRNDDDDDDDNDNNRNDDDDDDDNRNSNRDDSSEDYGSDSEGPGVDGLIQCIEDQGYNNNGQISKNDLDNCYFAIYGFEDVSLTNHNSSLTRGFG